MSTTSQIADALEESGIPFVRVEGVADGIEYWGLTVIHENIHAEVRECSDWVEMKVWHYTPEQFMNMLVGAGTCELINAADDLGKGTSSCMCFKCGYTALDDWWDEFNYCPQCGARIIKEVTE